MASCLRHRGPDGAGFFCDTSAGLAHTRLSIIDLATGDQPIHNEDSSVWIIFNGEIFNHIELRADLERRGHLFYTHSDTEVLVHLYEEHGDDFVTHLNGQFAIALWDKRGQRLLLCRDRAGILPLFYTQQRGRLLFASEIKALLPVLGASPELNPAALDQILTFWAPLHDATIFDGVLQLPPGEMLIVTREQVKRHCYWQWTYPVDGDYHRRSEAELAEQLRALLLDATRLRLRADVPVGAYLSGGFDSSALVALIHSDGIRPNTFSIRFEDEQLDEGQHQQQMVAQLNVPHREVLCRSGDVGREFLDALWHMETPVVRSAPTPMKMLSRLVRDSGGKVVLTGEGADEVFGGYDIFKEAKIRRYWAQQPDSRWRPLLLKRLYPYLKLSPGRSQRYSEAFFGAGLDHPKRAVFAHLPRWNTTAQCKAFYSEEFKARLNEDPVALLERGLPPDIPKWHPFNRAQYIESKTLMANYLLCSQGDRMLMANSVEGRFPFLDHRVMEFANRLHPRLKMRVLNEKYLLKRALRNDLPESILRRPKQPYRAPDIPGFFTNGKALDYVDTLCGEETLHRYGYFDPQKTALLLKKIRAGRAIGYKDNMAFVAVLSTQAWHHLFIEQKGEYARFSPALP